MLASTTTYKAEEDPEWIAYKALSFLLFGGPLLLCCCCMAYAKIENSCGLGRVERGQRSEQVPTTAQNPGQGGITNPAPAPIVVVDIIPVPPGS